MDKDIWEERERQFKELGFKSIDILKKIEYIGIKFTGKVNMEMNLNQGGMVDIKVAKEERFK